ncbi:MAG: purine-nucleoside phosphorylase [Planctomycetes bacterium]|nr:purine-nucleoside phosphorylase [Planctomycetota bacterium]
MSTQLDPAARKLAQSLVAQGLEGARIAFVLGSGLGAFADRLERARSVPAADLDGLPQSGVPGHAGRLAVGEIGGVRVLVQQGRVHLYEGWSPEEVTRAVRAYAAIGVRALVLTNAAGGIRAGFVPGTLMRITDHLDLQASAPLAGAPRGFGTPWDAQLGAALEQAARVCGVALGSGVYAGLLGPAYETPAEIRWLREAGADAVGMSTVAEAAAGRAAGLRVCGVSSITNLAAGIGHAPLSHAEVVEAGAKGARSFCALLEHAVAPIASALRGH